MLDKDSPPETKRPSSRCYSIRRCLVDFEWAYCHLNGLYLPGSDDPKSIHWYEWLMNEGLAGTEIKIKLA
ncbi:hypothetical protein CEXT_191031 [Caerostris extrusa]|uniref:Uncharacterized protein n=1 Tax=Caerostris extrusa TaxID=172846 RepID=A0AAV4SSY8_CAEEX|nr:hypothetical protein CEXT_191031 [Caerostris extrusa]